MDKKNNNPEKFAELLAAYRKGHAEQGQFLSYVDRLSAQVRNNTICGSWIAQDGGCSLLIRSIEDGFSLMLCDNTRCYKTIIRQMTALAQGRRGVVVSEGPGGDITIGKDGLLRCGAYGIFRSEEDMLREEMDSEMEFAVRSATEDDGTF